MHVQIRPQSLYGFPFGIVGAAAALHSNISCLELAAGAATAILFFSAICRLLRLAAFDSDVTTDIQSLFSGAFWTCLAVALVGALALKLSDILSLDLVGASVISATIFMTYAAAAYLFIRATRRTAFLVPGRAAVRPRRRSTWVRPPARGF